MFNSPQVFVLYISIKLNFSKNKKIIRLNMEKEIPIFFLLLEIKYNNYGS